MIKPITPKQAFVGRTKDIPEIVIDVVNELIKKNYRSGQSTVKQDDIVKNLTDRGLKSSEIFDKGWLDIEDTYKKVGWIVVYDRPAYCENYPTTFTFKAPSAFKQVPIRAH